MARLLTARVAAGGGVDDGGGVVAEQGVGPATMASYPGSSPVGGAPGRAGCFCLAGRGGCVVAFDGCLVGVLGGAQAGGDAGGDGQAVGPAVGPFGQGAVVELDFADVGFVVAGAGGDGEDGDVGGGDIQDQGDGAAAGGVAGQGGDRGSSVSSQAISGRRFPWSWPRWRSRWSASMRSAPRGRGLRRWQGARIADPYRYV
jgi:hypothetical protein